jgi:hypothetical protein
MLLSVDAHIPFPIGLVFRTYRDDLLDLVEFMPTIRRVEIRSREEHGPTVKMVNVWFGGSEIPAPARVVMTDSLLSWTEHADWNEADFTCDWRIETHSFREAVECRGKNRFIADGASTQLEIRGDLLIDASQIRGVPKLLGKSLGKTVSDLLVKKITPNLIEATDGLRRYLERKQRV